MEGVAGVSGRGECARGKGGVFLFVWGFLRVEGWREGGEHRVSNKRNRAPPNATPAKIVALPAGYL